MQDRRVLNIMTRFFDGYKTTKIAKDLKIPRDEVEKCIAWELKNYRRYWAEFRFYYQEGKELKVCELVQKGLLTAALAAEDLDVTEEELVEIAKKYNIHIEKEGM